MKLLSNNRYRQSGASLIEVLIAVLILSFGMLALGSMLSFTIQLPKLSGYRATATNLSTRYIARIRANPGAFSIGKYDHPTSYDKSLSQLEIDSSKTCIYPQCDDGATLAALATMDHDRMTVATRTELPAGGLFMSRDSSGGTPSATEGNLWIIWQEPDTSAKLNPASSDNCPLKDLEPYKEPHPRCLYVRFKL